MNLPLSQTLHKGNPERPEAFASDPQVIYLLEVTTKVTGCPNADASDQAVSSTTDQYASI
jgi:hypothetical protein